MSETMHDAVPAAQTQTAAKPALLRRPWLAWTVGAVVAAGLGRSFVVDHNGLVARLDETQTSLDDARGDIETLEQRLTSTEGLLRSERETTGGLREVMVVCLDALDADVRLWNRQVRTFNAATNLDLAQFERWADAAEQGRKKANKALKDCREGVA